MSPIGKQFMQLGLLSLVSYPLGFLLQMLMSYYFGTSLQVDAYWVVLTLVNFCGFFVHPVREAVVSGYHLRRAQGQEAADRYFSSAVNLLVLLLSASTALLYGAPAFFAGWLVGTGKEELLAEVIRLLHYAAPLVTLLYVSEIFSGFLISTGRIFFQDVGRIVGSVLAVVSLWLLAGKVGALAMIVAALVSNLIMVALQLLTLHRAGFRYRLFSPPRIDSAALGMSGALILSYLVSQLYILYERTVFVGLGEGVLASFQYAIALNNVCFALCIGNICNVVWPRMVELSLAHDDDGVRQVLSVTLRNISLLLVFLCLFLGCYADVVSYLLFFRGEFDLTSLERTAGLFRTVLFSLPFLALSGIVGRLLASRQFTGYLFAVGVLSALGGMATLAWAQFTQSVTVAGCHTAVSAACGATVSAYAGYRLYLRQVTPAVSPAILRWLVMGGLPASVTLLLFISLPLTGMGGKFAVLVELVPRFAAGGVLFVGIAHWLGLFHLPQGFDIGALRRLGRSA